MLLLLLIIKRNEVLNTFIAQVKRHCSSHKTPPCHPLRLYRADAEQHTVWAGCPPVRPPSYRAGRVPARATPMVMQCGPQTYREGPGVCIRPPCLFLTSLHLQPKLLVSKYPAPIHRSFGTVCTVTLPTPHLFTFVHFDSSGDAVPFCARWDIFTIILLLLIIIKRNEVLNSFIAQVKRHHCSSHKTPPPCHPLRLYRAEAEQHTVWAGCPPVRTPSYRAGRMSARATPMVMQCGPRTYREGPGVGVVYPPCRPLRLYRADAEHTVWVGCLHDVRPLWLCRADPGNTR